MIEVEHLTKRYGDVRAVQDISFEVERGSIVGFLGPNGAGKSTTLRIVAGFLGATEGTVRIGGHDIAAERLEALGCLGYMAETSPLYPEMRVCEYLRFRAELKSVTRAKRKAEVERVLELARVDDMADVPIGHLSKGYRQRVGIADALLGAPPLLILDEPTAGLDPNQIRDVRGLIRDLGERHTVLLSTHILSEVEAACERAIVIHRGKLVGAGTIEEIRGEGGAAGLDLVVRGYVDKARRVLAKQRGVGAIDATPLEDELCEIRVTLRDDAGEPGELAERIVAALAKANIRLRQVTPRAASLEQVFARLTEGEHK